ncbi:ABC transporter permease, partial [candidate division KSB1 bacterium]
TEKIAEKYFGQDEPIDKILHVNNKQYTVTGIVKESPNNSHFHYDLICSEHRDSDMWYSYMYTYILLPEGYQKSEMESKLDKLVEDVIGPQMKDLMGISYNEYIASGKKWEYRLQKITDIHLRSDLLYELEPGGNVNYVYVLFCSGILVFAAACINYISISTASSIKRAKEVSLRKVFGSKRRNIVGQFLSESTLLCGISVLLSIIIVELALPVFNNYTGKEISIPYFDSVFTLPVISIIIVTMGIISGWYPAFYMSSFTPIKIIKGRIASGNRQSIFKNALVTLQLTVSLSVIIGALVISSQIEYISGKDLGFGRENVLVVEKSSFRVSQKDAYTQELLKDPNILSVSFSDNEPGEGLLISMHYPEGADMSAGKNLNIIRTDHNFMRTLDLKLKYGRSFSREIASDSYEIILNEKAVADLGIKDPVGKRIIGYDPQSPDRMVPKEIIGVLEDFHYASLHTAIKPFMIERVLDDFTEKLLIRIKSDNITKTIEYIDETAKRFDPEDIYSYQFLDDKINALYDLDRKMSEAFIVFSVITIFIGCLGLFGLIYYTCQQKQREVSIRKVLGATGLKIVLRYSIDLLILIAVAAMIASPVSYFILKNWLSNFAYQIDITIIPFISGCILISVVVMVTVFFHIMRSALVNPVESLRHE